ncbi:hypothetical protein Y045_5813 [Burkholderia pseudomallei MSHR2451]|nr:hypothetical protein Y045_5813 [Burkholderia pseudomallei MSHR2451]
MSDAAMMTSNPIASMSSAWATVSTPNACITAVIAAGSGGNSYGSRSIQRDKP